MPVLDRATQQQDLSGQADGVNVSFTVQEDYLVGTLAVFLNGKRQLAGSFFTETGTDTFSTSEAPGAADELQVQYEITIDLVGFDIVNASGVPPDNL